MLNRKRKYLANKQERKYRIEGCHCMYRQSVCTIIFPEMSPSSCHSRPAQSLSSALVVLGVGGVSEVEDDCRVGLSSATVGVRTGKVDRAVEAESAVGE